MKLIKALSKQYNFFEYMIIVMTSPNLTVLMFYYTSGYHRDQVLFVNSKICQPLQYKSMFTRSKIQGLNNLHIEFGEVRCQKETYFWC